MPSLVDSAASILSQSERRVEVAGQNISNITTPGYKRRVSFETLVSSIPLAGAQSIDQSETTDFSDGKTMMTGNPLDLALAGRGFFVLRAGGQNFYTRQGQFQRAADGRLVNAQGYAVQGAGGGDVLLKGGVLKVQPDGALLEDGELIAKLELADFAEGSQPRRAEAGLFVAGERDSVRSATPTVHQGMLEASNVSTGDEMIAVMAALRHAETGQRLMNVYDDLMGRVISAFGQS